MMKKLFSLIPAVSLAMVVFASHPAAAANAVTVVGTINGGGTSLMTSRPGGGGKRVSSFGIYATLYSHGTPSGHRACGDQKGGTAGGDTFLEGSGWAMGPSALTP